jgi:hypothetical protein
LKLIESSLFNDEINVICNYFALTSPALLSQLWERREFEAFLASFSQGWATVYTHLGSDTETLPDPPKSPLKRGTSDPVPSFLRRVREDQAQLWLD